MKQLIKDLAPIELVALALFIAMLAVWAVTLGVVR